MNSQIIDQFNLLIKQIEAEYLNAQVENNEKDLKAHKFRLQTIKKIVSLLKRLDFEITDSADLVGFPGIGEGTRKRVQEILDTGKLNELKSKYTKKKQNKIDNIQELTKIIGVGSSKAKEFVLKDGITSVEDLKKAIKKNKIQVNDKVKLGLKYYGLVQGAIPRKEIEQTEKYLVEVAHSIDPRLEIMICGSYRRGKATSGDIDVLMYHPSLKYSKDLVDAKQKKVNSFLEMFVNNLTEDGFLLDHMTDKNYSTKYMGFSQYKNYPVRRIDIRMMPYQSLAASMLSFTGPQELNTEMRTAAKKRNMILNEYGLYKLNEDGSKTLVKAKSEADIFHALGMEYLTPAQRELFSFGKAKQFKVPD